MYNLSSKVYVTVHGKQYPGVIVEVDSDLDGNDSYLVTYVIQGEPGYGFFCDSEVKLRSEAMEENLEKVKAKWIKKGDNYNEAKDEAAIECALDVAKSLLPVGQIVLIESGAQKGLYGTVTKSPYIGTNDIVVVAVRSLHSIQHLPVSHVTPISDEEWNAVNRRESALDVQTGGSHYKDCKIQPVEYIHGNNLSYLQGNVVKYVTRYKNKNGIEDLEKARHYLELIMELEYGD